jgi:hypothetical protein
MFLSSAFSSCAGNLELILIELATMSLIPAITLGDCSLSSTVCLQDVTIARSNVHESGAKAGTLGAS